MVPVTTRVQKCRFVRVEWTVGIEAVLYLGIMSYLLQWFKIEVVGPFSMVFIFALNGCLVSLFLKLCVFFFCRTSFLCLSLCLVNSYLLLIL